LVEATNESISIFGNKEAGGIVFIRTYDEYYNGYNDDTNFVKGYVTLIDELTNRFPIGKEFANEREQKDFIQLYGTILKLRNILTTFDDFKNNEILSVREVQDYHSMYIDLYEEFQRKNKVNGENVNEDIVFEMELIRQVEINIDYIMELIYEYSDSNLQDKEIIISIEKAIDASPDLRDKKSLIKDFIDSMTPETNIPYAWRNFVDERQKEELEEIIASEALDKDGTYEFMNNSLRDGYITNTGTAITEVLPSISRFSQESERSQKRENVLDKLRAFFHKFGIISKRIV
jgi:type I restriction enzyme R subunit